MSEFLKSLKRSSSNQDILRTLLTVSLKVAFGVSLPLGIFLILSGIEQQFQCPQFVVMAYVLGGFLLCTALLSGLMNFCRASSAKTLQKVILYPFSVKDLVEVSLTSGTVQISLFDVLLAYAYHLTLTFVAISAVVGLFEAVAVQQFCSTTAPFLFWGVLCFGTLSLTLILAYKILVILYLPCTMVEYVKLMLKNAYSGMCFICSFLKGLVCGS